MSVVACARLYGASPMAHTGSIDCRRHNLPRSAFQVERICGCGICLAKTLVQVSQSFKIFPLDFIQT